MQGLYLLWWVQEKHVPVAALAATLAAGDLALVALEVPTGWFADRCGHRLSLIVGSVLQVVGMSCCWLGQGVPGLLAASVTVAFGDAFRSGADQALLYRSCAAIDREADFQRIEANTRAVQLVAMVGLILAGGGIVERWGFAAGWVVEIVLCAAGLAIACVMAEPPHAPSRSPTRLPGRSPRELRPFIALIVPASLLACLTSAASFLIQTAAGTGAGRMTILVAVVTLAEAAGWRIAVRFNGVRVTVRSQMMLAGAGLLAMAGALAARAALQPAAILLSLLSGIALSLRAAAIQRASAEAVRARAASAAAACDKALTVAVLVGAGWLPRRT
jgi:MFS family permease